MNSQPDTRAATSSTEPFYLPAGPRGCLLIHGFTGTPHEMRFLGEQLYRNGHTTCGVRLAGHGTSVDELDGCTWRDWYTSTCDALSELQQRAPRVVVIGQSMGALLALKLAVDHPAAVRGVVLLSPALVLSRRWLGWIAPVLPLAFPFLGRRPRLVGKGDSDIADAQARAASPSYRSVPLRAMHQLLVLQQHVRSLLPQVRQPALVIHARQDHTCPLRNVALIERGLRGPVRSVLLEDSYHVISVDVDKERVSAEIGAFVDSVGR